VERPVSDRTHHRVDVFAGELAVPVHDPAGEIVLHAGDSLEMTQDIDADGTLRTESVRVVRAGDVPCGAEWSTEFSDSYYGLVATCDAPGAHSRHEGPARTWDGETDDPTANVGVRVSWPVTP
jgi:hypothetical protein